MLGKLRDIIVAVIDFCHKPFAKIIPTQTFRYIACGGANTVAGLLIYSVVFVRILHQAEYVHIVGDLHITSRIAAWAIQFLFCLPVGFLLSSYVVFPESQIHGRVQLFRYIMSTLIFLLMSYVLTKVFAIIMPIVRADIANIFVAMITTVLSYLTQRFFTFKITPEAAIEVSEEEVEEEVIVD